jgi:ketose-bisphosphate aldolase
MAELVNEAYRQGYAVPSFCVWNSDSMELVLRTAVRLEAPVILMSGPWEFGFSTPREVGAVAQALASLIPATAALHLDHGDSLERVEACLAAGYSSVMLDFSARPFEENIAGMRRTVELARPLGVTVEGELGLIGKVDDTTAEGSHESTLTDPAMAAEFVRRTGIDALAVSIGNAHGSYTTLPRLDFDRLAKLRDTAGIPLVLHGGSGTPPEDLRRAISLGMAKVNVATDIMNALRGSLLSEWQAGRNLWVPLAQATALRAAEGVLEKWIHLTGAAGKASSKGRI